ncbi:MAG: SpoIID/LytB domain protein [Clostridia bacterium]|nr:SpoIID/LytB domain protein [Clostridia bacterium]
MKNFIRTIAFIGGCLFLIPLIIVYASGYQSGEVLQEINRQKQQEAAKANNPSLIDQEKLIGILAKEVPYTHEYEAVKAQAVVVRTYMARRILGIQNKGELVGYTAEEMKKLWGENYNDIYKTYEQAVKETQNEIILYNDEPIEALYHEASGGRTRDAKAVYNVDIPYLKNVVSEEDNISKQIKLSKSEMANQLREVYPDIVIDETLLENQIQIVEKDEAEYIKSIQIGNAILKGEDFRTILGLPSSNFSIFNQGKYLVFDVRGVGHGIGLSQNGANELAKSGKTYKDIIKYYYTDISIQNYVYKK